MFAWFDRSPRLVLALVAAACVAMLAFGLYLQHVVGLEPCPMCIVQRYALLLVAVFAGAAALFKSRAAWLAAPRAAVARSSPAHERARRSPPRSRR